MTPQERIKADAKLKGETHQFHPLDGDYASYKFHGFIVEQSYIAGATAEHDRAQERDNIFKDAMQQVLNVASWADDPYKSTLRKVVNNAIEKWEGKEVELELKEPDKNYNLSTEEKKKLLANKIEARMKEVGLQRQEFADLMGTQPSTITQWLSGEHNFQIDTLFEIEKQLNISLFNL